MEVSGCPVEQVSRTPLVSHPCSQLGWWVEDLLHARKVSRVFAGKDLRTSTNQRPRKIVRLSIRVFTEAVVAQTNQEVKQRVSHDDPCVGVALRKGEQRFEGLLEIAVTNRRIGNRQKKPDLLGPIQFTA